MALPIMEVPEGPVGFDRLNGLIAHDLLEKGWSVQPAYLPSDITGIISDRLAGLQTEKVLTPAGIGRLDDHQVLPDIRRDKTYWLEKDHPADLLYLKVMENMRLCLNRSLFLGLFEYESHYALYPEGGFYKKHIDALKGGKNRIVSTVCYLNENWQMGDGGMLALYNPADETQVIALVEPVMGTMVVFLSEEMPHEVTAALKPRKSIAGWFRCNSSSGEKADPHI